MIAQYRPDIARAAEETVLHMKELENRIEVLRNDLAWLCQSVGHFEAARVAATPTRSLGGTPAGGFYATGALANPYAAVPALGSTAGFLPGFQTLGVPGQQAFAVPSIYSTPFGMVGALNPALLGAAYGQASLPTAFGAANIPAWGYPSSSIGVTHLSNPPVPILVR